MTPPTTARDGLPDHLFRYVSSITPMVNVDLVLACPDRGILLTWRHDEFYGPGWHVPGGIIRFKESATQRLFKVGEVELGCTAMKDVALLSAFEIMNPTRDVRGHFISFLFSAYPLDIEAHPSVENPPATWANGVAAWHKAAPVNLISQHERYRPLILDVLAGRSGAGVLRGNLAEVGARDHSRTV